MAPTGTRWHLVPAWPPARPPAPSSQRHPRAACREEAAEGETRSNNTSERRNLTAEGALYDHRYLISVLAPRSKASDRYFVQRNAIAGDDPGCSLQGAEPWARSCTWQGRLRAQALRSHLQHMWDPRQRSEEGGRSVPIATMLHAAERAAARGLHLQTGGSEQGVALPVPPPVPSGPGASPQWLPLPTRPPPPQPVTQG